MVDVGQQRVERTKGIHVMVPISLFKEVKLLLMDPLRGRVKYRAMSGLMTSLLKEWVEKQRKDYVEREVEDE